MGDPRLVGYVIGPELDAMLDATGRDERHSHRIVIDVLALAVEHVAHGDEALQCVALRAASRRHVSFPAGHPDRVVENRLDGFGLDAAAVVLDGDRPVLYGNRDDRRDLGFLTGIQRIVHQLLEHDQRPVIGRVTGLILQLALGAELHEPRDPEGHAGQFRLRLCLGFPASGLVRLCHNL